jgi:hypothetical protein
MLRLSYFTPSYSGGKEKAPTIESDMNWTEFQRRLLDGRRKEKTVFASIDIDILVPYKRRLHACVSTFDPHVTAHDSSFSFRGHQAESLGLESAIHTASQVCKSSIQYVPANTTQAPQVTDYPSDLHVLAEVSQQIKSKWPCSVHGTCYISSGSEHVTIHRHRLKEWAARIVSHPSCLRDIYSNSSTACITRHAQCSRPTPAWIAGGMGYSYHPPCKSSDNFKTPWTEWPLSHYSCSSTNTSFESCFSYGIYPRSHNRINHYDDELYDAEWVQFGSREPTCFKLETTAFTAPRCS